MRSGTWPTVGVVLRRTTWQTFLGDRLEHALIPWPRGHRGLPRFLVGWGWSPGRHVVERIVVTLRPTWRAPAPPDPAPAGAAAGRPLPAGLPVDASRLLPPPSGPLATLADLRAGPVAIASRGRWVGEGDTVDPRDPAPRGALARPGATRGPRGRLGEDWRKAGIALRSPRGDAVKLVLVGSTQLDPPLGGPGVWLDYNRSTGWDRHAGWAPVADGGAPVDLVLEQRGEFVLAFAGPEPSPDRLVTREPLHFPLGEPLEVCLFMNRGAGEAVFDEVEIERLER